MRGGSSGSLGVLLSPLLDVAQREDMPAPLQVRDHDNGVTGGSLERFAHGEARIVRRIYVGLAGFVNLSSMALKRLGLEPCRKKVATLVGSGL